MEVLAKPYCSLMKVTADFMDLTETQQETKIYK